MSDTIGQTNNRPTRPAWMEVDLGQLAENFRLIRADAPDGLAIGSVVKDAAYGHGAVEVARVALGQGADCLLVSNLDEAAELRNAGITAPVLLMGERMESELPACLELGLTLAIGNTAIAEAASRLASSLGRALLVHVKIDTGMSRYGVRWDASLGLVEKIAALPGLQLDGMFSHFSMSDELDKSFACEQLVRLRAACAAVEQAGLAVRCRHLCNSGGFLDLPEAHLDMVRIGLLALGVFPSQVCRRIDGIEPVGTLKTRLAVVRDIRKGDNVGYGLSYQSSGDRRLGVLPLGYGDGYPRVRNEGHVLVHGKRAPIIGANAMDSTMVDVTDIPEAAAWDEVVLMGRQGDCKITAHDLAAWKGTVSYEVLVGWRSRLPRIHLGGETVD